jgi:hypothetical protein
MSFASLGLSHDQFATPMSAESKLDFRPTDPHPEHVHTYRKTSNNSRGLPVKQQP